MEASAVRAFRAGSLALLLDGFDEIGSQAWSNDSIKLKTIRANSLEGVKDAVNLNKGGTLITGREHYFPNSEEMFSALGMNKSNTILLRSKNEFSDTELLEYFRNRDIEVDIPEWLPRRPLICQTISDLAADQFAMMFGEEGDEIAFWNHFIKVLCARDASIHVSFDPETIFRIFSHLARLTRSKSANVGPISLAELQSAFEAATGAAPVEEASIMLQRLPSLGRVNPESNDRQFVDVYILDGLRAKDIVNACVATESEFAGVSTAKWVNPLDDLGQRVLAADDQLGDKAKLNFAKKSSANGNIVFASDIVGSLTRKNRSGFDFENFDIENGEFLLLSLDERPISNIRIRNSYIGELSLPALECKNVSLDDCITPRVTGVSSERALPAWIRRLTAEEFDSVASVSRIRKIGLAPSHEILTTIIRKTFFQKGAGRKEEALLRGLGKLATKNTSTKIINTMIRHGLLTTFKGEEGTVYSPVRTHTARMQAILNELGGSKDPLWIEIGEI